nr:hypothetical protein HmN_000148900 [Hymenolepis microstoma]
MLFDYTRLVLLLTLNYFYFPLSAVQQDLLQGCEDCSPESVDCERFPESLECEDHHQIQKKPCTYNITLRSKFFPSELAVLCGWPRHTLPCMINNAENCDLSPMEFSEYELAYLQLVNIELQVRINDLYRQYARGIELTLETQREVEQITSDNLYWLCSRKCSNSTCVFDAELRPQRSSHVITPSMTALTTEYPDLRRGGQIKILLPLGSNEISRLLKKATPFKHLAVSSLPLTISCKRC